MRYFKFPRTLVLVAFALTLLAPIAAAQSLVSNINQSRNEGHNGFQAQSFTTGSGTVAFDITSVQIYVHTAGMASVTLRGDNSGVPGSLLGTFTGTASAGLRTFTAPQPLPLLPSTTYWISVNEGLSGQSDRAYYWRTNSNSQTGASGWSIGDGLKWRDNEASSWSDHSTSLLIAIGGGTGGAPTYAPWDIVANGFDRRVELGWRVVPDATGYQYRQSITGGSSFGEWTNIHHATRFYGTGARAFGRVSGLANGTTYTFQLRGVNNVGQGPGSGWIDAKPLAPPPTPTLNSATGVNGALALGITGGATSTTRMPARTFVAEKAQCAGLTTAQCRERLDTVGYSWLSGNNEVVGLTNGITYSVRVLAANRLQDEPNTRLVLSAPSTIRSATPTGPPDPRCTHAIEGNGRISGEWRFGCNSAARPGRKAQYYTFTLAESREVTLSLTSSIDPYLFVREGTIVDGSSPRYENDDSGGTRNSRIVATLQAGSYVVEAATYLAGRSGPFIFEIAGLAHDAPPQVETTTTTTTDDGSAALFECAEWLASDGEVSGSWNADCTSAGRGDSHYARYYVFTLNERSAATITLASDVDSYLYLREGSTRDGRIIGEDDDGAGNYNARIGATLDAGTYVIEATTYYHRESGSFTLRLGDTGDAIDAEPAVSGGTPDDGRLGTPIAVATAHDYGVSLSWNAITGATGYEYEWVYADKAWWDTDWIKRRSVGANTLAVELSDELGVSRYSFRVRAVKVEGGEREESPWSPTVTVSSY